MHSRGVLTIAASTMEQIEYGEGSNNYEEGCLERVPVVLNAEDRR